MSLLSKLKLQPDRPLWLLHAPDTVAAVLAHPDVHTSLRPEDAPGQMLIFLTTQAELAGWVPAIQQMVPQALVWLAYPKKSSGIATDLARDASWAPLTALGWMPVAQVAVDANWSALRFKPAADIHKLLRQTPLADRQTEGVDYQRRTVTLPADVQQHLQQLEGTEACFMRLSFSHQREYLEAIAGAKKPETRQRRIAAMGAKLQAQLQQKK